MDIRRFGAHAASRTWARAGRSTPTRATTTSSTRGEEWTGRPAAAPLRRPGPGCADLDAALGEKAGWERVNWFDSNAAAGAGAPRPTGWAGPHLVAGDRGRGAARPRDAAGLFDQSSFAKLDVRGPGAVGCSCNRLCANDVDKPVGSRRLHAAAQRSAAASRPT